MKLFFRMVTFLVLVGVFGVVLWCALAPSPDRKVGGCKSNTPELSGVRDFGDGVLRDGICVVRSEARRGSMCAGFHLSGDGLLRGSSAGGGAVAGAGAIFRSG